MESEDEPNRAQRMELMGEGPVGTALFALAVPAILGMLTDAVYNFVDTIFVGMLHDTAAMASVSISFPILLVISAVGSAIGVGGASHVSRSLGAERKHTADTTASIAFFTSLGMGVLCVVAGTPLLELTLRAMGASPAKMPSALAYTQIIVIGAPCITLDMTLNSLIRAEGNSTYSMIANIAGALANIVLDPIFIFGFKMGVRGAAFATILGYATTAGISLYYYLSRKSYVTVDAAHFSFDQRTYREIARAGLPSFFSQSLTSLSSALLIGMAMHYGDAAVAGLGVSTRVETLVLYVLLGYSQGFRPFAGYNYGARNYGRLKEGLRTSLIWTTGFSLLCTIVLTLWAEPVLRIFSRDPEVVAIGANLLVGAGLIRPMLGFLIVYMTFFQALGKTKAAGLLAISRQGLFLIPITLTLPEIFEKRMGSLGMFTRIMPNSMAPGLYGIAYAQSLADLLALFVTAVLAFSISAQLRAESARHASAREGRLRLKQAKMQSQPAPAMPAMPSSQRSTTQRTPAQQTRQQEQQEQPTAG